MEDIKYFELSEKLARLEEVQKAQKENISIALAAAEKAVTKAEMANEKRFDSVNEFRQTLDAQQKTFITAKEAEAKFKSIEDKIVILVSNQTLNLGKHAGGGEAWAYVVGAAGILFGVVAILLKFIKP